MIVPGLPAPGVKEVMVGVATGMVVVPQGDIICTCVTGPLPGSEAVSCVELTICKLAAVCPLIFTTDTLSRFLPLMVMVVPALPVAGETCVTDGS
jgi:hypothetical protein